jgi:hypothetical protein
MKKIMMNKFGFVRWPEEDFSDDGNRFTCYKVGKRVRVSKTVSDGRAYISARIDDGQLPYESYSELPYYCDLDRLNGVSVTGVTEDDLQRLYESCLAYEKAYTDAENSIQYPTLAEITEQCDKIHARAVLDANRAQQLFSSKFLMATEILSDYEWKRIREYIVELNKRARRFDSELKIEEFANNIYRKSYSFSFCAPTYSDLNESWYYQQIVKLLKRV